MIEIRIHQLAASYKMKQIITHNQHLTNMMPMESEIQIVLVHLYTKPMRVNLNNLNRMDNLLRHNHQIKAIHSETNK